MAFSFSLEAWNALAQVPGAGFGGQIPARIFRSYMERALYLQPVLEFPDPGPACDREGKYVSEKGRGVAPPPTTATTVPPVVTAPPVVTVLPTAPPAT